MTTGPLRIVRAGDPPTPPTSWTLTHEARPLPMNAYRRLHYHARARYDREWRGAFHLLARRARIPRLAAVTVIAAQTCRPGPRLPDPGALFPTAKAAIDGLVDAGVIADDTGEFVRFIGMAAPERSDLDRFLLVIEPYPESDTP